MLMKLSPEAAQIFCQVNMIEDGKVLINSSGIKKEKNKQFFCNTKTENFNITYFL